MKKKRICEQVWTKPYFKVKILMLKCSKFDFGSTPDPAGELITPPNPLAGFKETYF